MVLYEFLPASPCEVSGLLGITMFVGFQALLRRHVIGGDGLVFIAGNTVAAALVLSSNFSGAHPLWILAQIALIAAAMLAMIAQFHTAAEER